MAKAEEEAGMKQWYALLGSLLLVGCMTVQEEPVSYKPDSLCIERNPVVEQEGFVQGLRDGLQQHGISAKSYRQLPQHCDYVLSYRYANARGLDRSLTFIDLVIRDAQGQLWASTRYQVSVVGSVGRALGAAVNQGQSLEAVVNELMAQAGWSLYLDEQAYEPPTRQLRDL